jgi:hypothetical protein
MSRRSGSVGASGEKPPRRPGPVSRDSGFLRGGHLSRETSRVPVSFSILPGLPVMGETWASLGVDGPRASFYSG